MPTSGSSLSNSASSPEMTLAGRCDQLMLADSMYIKGLALESDVSNDSALFRIHWDNQIQPSYAGNMEGFVLFENRGEEASRMPGRTASIGLRGSWISVHDSIWTIEGGKPIVFNQKSMVIDDWQIFRGKRKLRVNGFSSIIDPGGITLSFEGFHLSAFND